MSRAPTDRLRALDGRALAKATIDDALSKVGSVLFSIAPFSDYRITTGDGQPLRDADPMASVVGSAVICLTAYAQSGTPLDADVHEYCVSLIPVAGDALDDAMSPDVTTDLGLVVAAAMAREAIEEGRPVSLPHLEALAGLARKYIYYLVDRGELVAKKGAVSASNARAWLSGRGVQVARKDAT